MRFSANPWLTTKVMGSAHIYFVPMVHYAAAACGQLRHMSKDLDA